MKDVLIGLLFFLIPTSLVAQTSLSGKVVDVKGQGIPFVNVIVKGTTKGCTTDMDGGFVLKGAAKGDVLKISMVGFKTGEVPVEKGDFMKIILKEEDELLDEIVVTGVAVGTSTKKLGFALSKVNKEELTEVAAMDVGNALRGKVAGIRVVQSSGDPNTPAAIRLRGSNSILGSQNPLIIIDGIITGNDTNLKDINMEDVESVEVIKGAAASSLYGSLSGNGVIHIITKRGRNAGAGKPVFVVRSESGFSKITREYPLATTHRWKLREGSWNLNDLNEQGRWMLDSKGNRMLDEDGVLDNPYPRTLDNQSKIYTARPTSTFYTSISDGDKKFRYHLSFQRTKQGGAIVDVSPSVRNNGRLNIDYFPNKKIALKTSASYTAYKGFNAPRSTRANALYTEPWIDLSERASDGNFARSPQGYKYLNELYDNPLYDVNILEDNFDRQRLMFSPALTYFLNANWTFGTSYSHDESRSENYKYVPKGYEEPDPTKENNGSYSIRQHISKTSIAQVYFSYTKQIGDFDTRLTAKFLNEERAQKSLYAGGSDLSVGGVKNLIITGQDTRDISSLQKEEKVNNFFLEGNMDYKDKLIFNGLVRRDGSSLFGENNRWQTFGRISTAYILTEDIKIPAVNDLKIRFSWGVSGQRPNFETQYETYSFDSRGRLVPNILGNKNLMPSKVSEWEAGINAQLFDGRVNAEVNYAKTNVNNDFIKAPLAKVTGFSYQWRNIGSIESNSFEIQLGADIIKTSKLNWNVNINWDRGRQRISDLGDVPPFSRSSSLFRVEAGRPYGRMYGYKIVKNINDLTLNDAGFVINSLGNPNAGSKGKLKPQDFEINEQGYVIIKGSKGTKEEQVILLADENGDDLETEIGNTNSDWNLGISSSVNWNGLSLYVLIDHQHGGDIYNRIKQRLYREERHGEQEYFARQGKHILYSNNASNLDRGRAYTSHFVEDGTFTKIREVSLSYSLNKKNLGGLGKIIDQVKIALIGRNLFTFTKYTGFDPEVSYVSSGIPNPTNDKMDDSSYPQFRTYTGMLQITF